VEERRNQNKTNSKQANKAIREVKGSFPSEGATIEFDPRAVNVRVAELKRDNEQLPKAKSSRGGWGLFGWRGGWTGGQEGPATPGELQVTGRMREQAVFAYIKVSIFFTMCNFFYFPLKNPPCCKPISIVSLSPLLKFASQQPTHSAVAVSRGAR
jgi:hypothetical protein